MGIGIMNSNIKLIGFILMCMAIGAVFGTVGFFVLDALGLGEYKV